MGSGYTKGLVMVNGAFDPLTAGHVSFMKRARALGGTMARLVVAINSDASILSYKGFGRPIYTLAERELIISELRCVDEVVPFNTELELRELIVAWRPEILAKGEEYEGQPITGSGVLKETGGRIVFLPRENMRSAGDIIRSCKVVEHDKPVLDEHALAHRY